MFRGKRIVVSMGLLAGLITSAASAHVTLDLPNGGEVLEEGSTYTITWHVAIQHNLENWDLWYSTTGPDGPWIEIVMDLPAGDPSADSIHTYDWTIPADASEQVRVRVRQDNGGTDYYDHSDGDLSIELVCTADLDGNGVVDAVDLATVLGGWGPCQADCPADLTGDGEVEASDLGQLLGAWGPCDASE